MRTPGGIYTRAHTWRDPNDAKALKMGFISVALAPDMASWNVLVTSWPSIWREAYCICMSCTQAVCQTGTLA